MKRLLLLTFLCVMPAAQAVDYVKCEAMQKAMSRLKTRQRQLQDPSRHVALNRKTSMMCKHLRRKYGNYGTPEYKEKYPAYDKCKAAERKKIISSPEFQSDKQELNQIPQRIAAVQTDYEAAGCY